jgi:hypothetical protein
MQQEIRVSQSFQLATVEAMARPEEQRHAFHGVDASW